MKTIALHFQKQLRHLLIVVEVSSELGHGLYVPLSPVLNPLINVDKYGDRQRGESRDGGHCCPEKNLVCVLIDGPHPCVNATPGTEIPAEVHETGPRQVINSVAKNAPGILLNGRCSIDSETPNSPYPADDARHRGGLLPSGHTTFGQPTHEVNRVHRGSVIQSSGRSAAPQ